MFDIRCNFFEHQILVTASGKTDLNEIQSASQDLLKNAHKLGAGFVLISDIRELAPAPEEGRIQIQNTLKELLALGMAGEIRIVNGQNAVTSNQWQRTSRSIGYTAPEVKSLVEAENFLDQLE